MIGSEKYFQKNQPNQTFFFLEFFFVTFGHKLRVFGDATIGVATPKSPSGPKKFIWDSSSSSFDAEPEIVRGTGSASNSYPWTVHPHRKTDPDRRLDDPRRLELPTIGNSNLGIMERTGIEGGMTHAVTQPSAGGNPERITVAVCAACSYMYAANDNAEE